MSSECSYFFHRGVFPDNDLVEGIAVGGYNLVVVLTKHQVAYLASSVD